MKTVTYATIQELAAECAGRPENRLQASEATLLRAFLALRLGDLWAREQWPELCDHLEAVTLDDTNAFSKREGSPDEDAPEMGDILNLFVGGDPRVTSGVTRLPPDRWVEGDARVLVLTPPGGGALYVEWQTPCPDLLDDDALGIGAAEGDDYTSIDEYPLPARFKLPLAYLGASHLLAEEDPGLSDRYRGLAEQELQRQASRLHPPWWRQLPAGE